MKPCRSGVRRSSCPAASSACASERWKGGQEGAKRAAKRVPHLLAQAVDLLPVRRRILRSLSLSLSLSIVLKRVPHLLAQAVDLLPVPRRRRRRRRILRSLSRDQLRSRRLHGLALRAQLALHLLQRLQCKARLGGNDCDGAYQTTVAFAVVLEPTPLKELHRTVSDTNSQW
jgi:hypothetical protein